MQKITEANLKDKNVILRVDFNVPILNKKIVDDKRIKATLPTIKYILNSGIKKLYLVSHMGEPVFRPKEKIKDIISGNKTLQMEPVARDLAKWLKIEILRSAQNDNSKFQGDKIKLSEIEDSPLPGYILSDKLVLLENIRFLEGEKKNDNETARKLSLLGDIYVDDAFGVLHRKHASVVAITKFLPSFYGFLIEKEIDTLNILLKNPEHPFVVVIGGAKVKDKIKIMQKLVNKADYFLLGGVMANTFLATRNVDTKNSVVEKTSLELANNLMDKAARKIILPTDLIWDSRGRIVDLKKGTVEQYKRYINKAKLIFFNGTVGLTSQERYRQGTLEILKAIAENKDAKSIICGGDTIAEVDSHDMANKFSYVSTGGGAALSFLAGEKLPGLQALEQNE